MVTLQARTIECATSCWRPNRNFFYITDHYKPWPMLLARLAKLDSKTLKELVAARVTEIEAKPKKKKRTVKKVVKKRKK